MHKKVGPLILLENSYMHDRTVYNSIPIWHDTNSTNM